MHLPAKALLALVGILRRKFGTALHRRPAEQWESLGSAAGDSVGWIRTVPGSSRMSLAAALAIR